MQGVPQLCGCGTASVTIWPLYCEITVWARGRRWDDTLMLRDEGDDEFWVGGNYSTILVLPSGTQSPLVWSRCSPAEIPYWNEVTGGAGSPTKVVSSSLRPPSWRNHLPAVTLLSNPIPHTDAVKQTSLRLTSTKMTKRTIQTTCHGKTCFHHLQGLMMTDMITRLMVRNNQ